MVVVNKVTKLVVVLWLYLFKKNIWFTLHPLYASRFIDLQVWFLTLLIFFYSTAVSSRQALSSGS